MTKKFFNPWDFLGFCLFYILALADKLLSINNMTTIRCRRIAAANYSETAENQGVGRQRGRGNGEPRGGPGTESRGPERGNGEPRGGGVIICG